MINGELIVDNFAGVVWKQDKELKFSEGRDTYEPIKN